MKLPSSSIVQNSGAQPHTIATGTATADFTDRPITHEFGNYHSGCITGAQAVPPLN